MKTKFSLKHALLIAAGLLAVSAISYGQAGTDVKNAAEDTGHATKTAAKDTGHGVKKGTEAVGHGVKKGAEKTGDEMK